MNLIHEWCLCSVCVLNWGIIRRDLKPENILVTIDGDLKVTDFGVSHDFSGDDSASDSSRHLGIVKDTKGSWSYWSPEMIDNDHANSYSAYAADVWAAGVCLWQFLFGCLPFWAPQPGNAPQPIFEEILASRHGPPSLPSRKSPELVEVFAAIFQADPACRPSFRDLSTFAWLQQHSDAIIEAKLKKASSVTIDRSAESLDEEHAVTPGEVNVLTEATKSHILRMAQRVKARVQERRSSIKQLKDDEIESKKEVRRSFDIKASNDSNLAAAISEIVVEDPTEHGLACEQASDVPPAVSDHNPIDVDRSPSRTPPILEDPLEDETGRYSATAPTETDKCLEGDGATPAARGSALLQCCIIL